MNKNVVFKGIGNKARLCDSPLCGDASTHKPSRGETSLTLKTKKALLSEVYS
ncbi:MAG: hypothetical protein Unbinned8472contig1000_34 [Prokaryotic dsDNA virus sp.]|nr:MAG: hypothetical protein Unbinned8472contig1000_34 [Prokaryotic dsDNA virus sp.]